MIISEEEKKEMLEDGLSFKRKLDFQGQPDLKIGKKEFENWVIQMHALLHVKPSRDFIEYTDVRL